SYIYLLSLHDALPILSSKSYPVRKVQLSKSALCSSENSVSASGVSFSGSTENETNCTLSFNSFSSSVSCKADMFLVIGGQTVVQFVNTKSATHHSPEKSLFITFLLSLFTAFNSPSLKFLFSLNFFPQVAYTIVRRAKKIIVFICFNDFTYLILN